MLHSNKPFGTVLSYSANTQNSLTEYRDELDWSHVGLLKPAIFFADQGNALRSPQGKGNEVTRTAFAGN
jgi:hypothetical protein